MRGHGWLIALANVFLACAVTVFMSFTAIQLIRYDRAVSVPFGLPDESVAVRVDRSVPPPQISEVAGVRREIVRLLGESETVLVWVGSDLGLAVYDSMGFFSKNKLLKGQYFDRGDFSGEVPAVLVKYESPLYRMIDDGLVMVSGTKTTVRGIYGQGHPLYTEEHTCVVIFANTTSLQGTYYFISDSHVVSEIVGLLEQQGYSATVIPTTYSVATALRMFLNPQYIMTAAGLVFICFNCFMLYFVHLTRLGKVFFIHRRFGATKRKLRDRFLSHAWPPIGIGTLLGIISYAMPFRLSDGLSLSSLPVWVAPIAAMFNMICSTALLITAFSMQKIWRTGDEKAC